MPEGDARTHLAVDAGVEVDDVFGMMNAYGTPTQHGAAPPRIVITEPKSSCFPLPGAC
jgi:hypothetical protein